MSHPIPHPDPHLAQLSVSYPRTMIHDGHTARKFTFIIFLIYSLTHQHPEASCPMPAHPCLHSLHPHRQVGTGAFTHLPPCVRAPTPACTCHFHMDVCTCPPTLDLPYLMLTPHGYPSVPARLIPGPLPSSCVYLPFVAFF